MKKIKNKILIAAVLIFSMALAFPSYATTLHESELITPGKILVIGSEIDAETREVGYYCTVIGNGVRMRTSPYIRNDNIMRELYYGDKLWVYHSGINVANNDGYKWSYVKHIASATWGYVASPYFATDGIAGIDNPFLTQ